MAKKYTQIGVNTFVKRDGKILLGKRLNIAGSGEWALPGGHLEFMEVSADGARRELQEETGLIASGMKLQSVIDNPRPEDDVHYIHINFLAENVEGEPKIMEPDKCSEWGWFDINELPDNIFVGHQKVIEAFIEGKNYID